MRFSTLEIFLFEFVVWLGLWLLNDYVATLLTLIISAIVFCILIIALMAEGIERSKVPKKYFWVMAVSIAAPLLACAVYLFLFDGKISKLY
jgi:hypothetical protein